MVSIPLASGVKNSSSHIQKDLYQEFLVGLLQYQLCSFYMQLHVLISSISSLAMSIRKKIKL